MQNPRKARGFTLIELLVVIAIIGILAFIAYPAYQDQVRKARRADAKTAVSDLAARQEQYYANNKTYADTLAKLGKGTVTTSEQGYYSLAIAAGPTGNLATSYEITATAAGDQTKDSKCAQFKLNSQGTKTSLDSGSAASSGCW